MSENLYAFLLKLYPDHFRRSFGGEALRLVRDRALHETGFLPRLRLWLDLLCDLAISLPREYSRPRTALVGTAPPGGERSFQLLAQPSLNPALLCLGAALSVASFWACAFEVEHSGAFPALLALPLSLQEMSQSAAAQSQYPCKTAPPVRNSARNGDLESCPAN